MEHVIKIDCGSGIRWDLVDELRADGLRQHIDFDFEYKPSKMDVNTYEVHQERHMLFKFYDDLNATMYTLKWT
jgi:hypothetical protein